jgi:hypothetical protein
MNQAQLNRLGQQHIASIREAVRATWVRACEYDGIDPSAPFVVFSDDNPHREPYNALVEKLFEMQAQYRAGGYVGLRMR